jgi:predicted MFS family arabinose efflux permease
VNTTNASQLPVSKSDDMVHRQPTGADEWRSGWTLVFSSAIAMVLAAIPTASLGVFIAPLQAEFGWSRATITSAILTHALCVLLLSPLVGRIINKHGARRVGLTGIGAVSVAIAGVGLSGPSVISWYVAWIVVGIAQTFAGPIIWSTAIVRKFNHSRGLALAVMLSGTGVATALIAPATLAGIANWGWRATFWAFGATALLICFPLVYFLFRDPTSTGPSSLREMRSRPTNQRAQAGEVEKVDSWRTGRFAKMALCSFGVALALSALFVHLVPILQARGLSATEAVSVVSVLGVTQLVARLFGGHLLDRYFAPYVGAVMFAMIAVACLILLGKSISLPVAALVGILAGAGLGLELDLMAYLVSRYFGLRAYATCYGLLLGLYGIGFGAGAVLAGAAFDHFGTYQHILIVMTVILAGCGVVIATLGRYPEQTASSDPVKAPKGRKAA